MRTTVSIDDQLLVAAKRRARERGTTLGRVVDDALRRELAATEPHQAVTLPVFRAGTGLRPGVDLTSNRALRELLDDDRPPESLR